VLLTQAARGKLPPDFPHVFAEQRVSISGLELVVHGIAVG
jgi:hypothetical protein